MDHGSQYFETLPKREDWKGIRVLELTTGKLSSRPTVGK